MTRTRLNALLLALLVLTIAFHPLARTDQTRPKPWFPLSNMADPVAAESFSPSAVFGNGRTMQTPPEGTLPRDEVPWRYQATPADAARAGAELRNPIAVDETTLARGQVVYDTFCAVCHGAGGLGDGPVAQRGYPPPPSLLADNARTMPDGRMFHVVTSGQGNMPGYARQLTPEDRWKVIGYVRRLQQEAPQ